MSYRPKGKHVRIDDSCPQALGICDKTGFVFNRKDLVRQMEWRGNAIMWTGFYVGRPYQDVPNEQLRPPILPPDPVPVMWPRLQQPNVITPNQGPNIPINNLNYVINLYTGSVDGITALAENQRLALLQSGNIGTGLYGGGDIPAPYLSEGQKLSALEQYEWGP